MTPRYCDPLFGDGEWREQAQSWSDPDPEELRASRALEKALTGVCSTVSRPPASDSSGKTLESIEQEFAALVATWKEATEDLSSSTRIVSHPSYQRIIDLGKSGAPVVPLILRELRDTGGYWATALSAITGQNPVIAKHIGNPAKVREDWIAWGRRHGHL